ncbi:MAG TPA: hypothetical protein VLA58_10655 [Chitinophagaceae bacterium]|nr:hypothetical protein [Chitinophagaceae bacterium]
MRESLSYPYSWTILARLVSYLFHPLLVGVYMAAYMIFINPVYYNYVDPREKILSLATVFNNNFVFPVVVVLLLKGLGFIKSIYLDTAKERIVPYMASIIFFFWTWYVFYNKPEAPQTMKDMLQGIFYASILAMIANIYFKISMHAIGMGGLIGMMLMILFEGKMLSPLPFMVSILFAGMVMTSRLIASDHKKGDIVAGFVVGLFSQLLAATIL